jgi:hypothetical protein
VCPIRTASRPVRDSRPPTPARGGKTRHFETLTLIYVANLVRCTTYIARLAQQSCGSAIAVNCLLASVTCPDTFELIEDYIFCLIARSAKE